MWQVYQILRPYSSGIKLVLPQSLPSRYWYKIGMTSSLSTRWVLIQGWYDLKSLPGRQWYEPGIASGHTSLGNSSVRGPLPIYIPGLTGAQYVNPVSKIYCEKVKMCRFSSGNWFFCTKFVQLPVAGEWRNKAVHLQKRV